MLLRPFIEKIIYSMANIFMNKRSGTEGEMLFDARLLRQVESTDDLYCTKLY